MKTSSIRQHRKQFQPTFGKNGAIYPSEGMKALIRRQHARDNQVFVPRRHDFRSPYQRQLDLVRGAIRVVVLPAIVG